MIKQEIGLEKRFIDENIGYGVFATKKFIKGSFVVEYKGELLSYKEGCQREIDQANAPETRHSYLYLFKCNEKRYW